MSVCPPPFSPLLLPPFVLSFLQLVPPFSPQDFVPLVSLDPPLRTPNFLATNIGQVSCPFFASTVSPPPPPPVQKSSKHLGEDKYFPPGPSPSFRFFSLFGEDLCPCPRVPAHLPEFSYFKYQIFPRPFRLVGSANPPRLSPACTTIPPSFSYRVYPFFPFNKH